MNTLEVALPPGLPVDAGPSAGYLPVSAVEVALPRGLRVDHTWHRTAHLQPLSLEDEAFLFGQAESLTPAAQVTALLTRCLHSIGALHPITPEHVRSLTIGDR